MDLPDNVRYLIEALRGGGRSTFKGGKLVKQEYGPSGELDKPKKNLLDQRRRGYQLYAQEAQQMGESPQSYEEWMESQE